MSDDDRPELEDECGCIEAAAELARRRDRDADD